MVGMYDPRAISAAVAVGLASATPAGGPDTNANHSGLAMERNNLPMIRKMLHIPQDPGVVVTDKQIEGLLAHGSLHAIPPAPGTNKVAAYKVPGFVPLKEHISATHAQRELVEVLNSRAGEVTPEKVNRVLDHLTPEVRDQVAASLLAVAEMDSKGERLSTPALRAYVRQYAQQRNDAELFRRAEVMGLDEFKGNKALYDAYLKDRRDPSAQVAILGEQLVVAVHGDYRKEVREKLGIVVGPKGVPTGAEVADSIRENVNKIFELRAHLSRNPSEAKAVNEHIETLQLQVKDSLLGFIDPCKSPEANGKELREAGIAALRGEMEAAGMNPTQWLKTHYAENKVTYENGNAVVPAVQESKAVIAAKRVTNPMEAGTLVTENPKEAAAIVAVTPSHLKEGRHLVTLREQMQQYDYGESLLQRMSHAGASSEDRHAVAKVMFHPEAIEAGRKEIAAVVLQGGSLRDISSALLKIQGPNEAESVKIRNEAIVYFNEFVRENSDPRFGQALVAAKAHASAYDAQGEGAMIDSLRGVRPRR